MRQLGTVHTALAGANPWIRVAESDADKEKPVRKEGKSRIKDKVSDFGAAIYDPKFFWHHGGERKGVATVVLHPSYSGLL